MAFIHSEPLGTTRNIWVLGGKNTSKLFPLDKTIVFHFYDFVLVLSVVFSRCQLYSVSLSQRKLIPNSALFILPFREFYA